MSRLVSSGIRSVQSIKFSFRAEEKLQITVFFFSTDCFQMTHVFKDYGPGVRYIRFSHGGQDQVFWEGWYGIRVTDSCIEICPALDT